MKTMTISEALGTNVYPGRGILVGVSPDATKVLIAYFIMGRSLNSRNRVFVEDCDGIYTQAFKPELLSDPSLVIYRPVRYMGQNAVVTNGDQTDTVCDFLTAGKSFEDALRTRRYEPDPPNYTPRISALTDIAQGAFKYKLSILKSTQDENPRDIRHFFEYDATPGVGHLIHTYDGDGNPLPSYTGEPKAVKLPGDEKALAELVWQNLNAENRVSLYTLSICLKDGARSSVIINANKED